MNFLDTIFRIFMFLVPYAVCYSLYIWVGKKAWKAPGGIAKIIALIFVFAGTAYTTYKLVRSIGGIMTTDDFEFIIIIVTVVVLFFASIALAIGEPDKEKKAL